jgi:hypothetical protein
MAGREGHRIRLDCRFFGQDENREAETSRTGNRQCQTQIGVRQAKFLLAETHESVFGGII